ncbi:MAG: aspartate 1-decarboxylase [Rickettsiales bacterium]|nr:aspartate 1-decarboxylase [Rickettsiales bacterium]
MLITKLKSKISYATITHKNLYYAGSITIDKNIMEKANIVPGEKVQIVNLNNGERFDTYVIEGEPNSKIFGLNGATARRGELKDQIFIISYALINPLEEKINPIIIDLKNGE